MWAKEVVFSVKLQFISLHKKEQKLPTHCVQQGTQLVQVAVVISALKAI